MKYYWYKLDIWHGDGHQSHNVDYVILDEKLAHGSTEERVFVEEHIASRSFSNWECDIKMVDYVPPELVSGMILEAHDQIKILRKQIAVLKRQLRKMDAKHPESKAYSQPNNSLATTTEEKVF